MNRIAAVIILFVLLMGTLLFASNVHLAKASGTIYIRAGGSIDPSTAPISTPDNVTYTLTGNITSDVDGIVIERDNVALDGAGYTLQGVNKPDLFTGVKLSGRSNVTVKNLEIEAFEYGMKINCSSHNIISGNNITENYHFGILLVGSSGNSISGNNITENSHIGVWLDGSSNNVIFRNNITDAEFGVLLERSNTNRVSRNFIAKNAYHGLVLSESSNNCINHNNFINNTRQAFSDSVNVWDDGYPSGGNYWSDYNGLDLYDGSYQNLTGSDGIGDTHYITDADNTDDYPLMGMFLDFNATSEHHVQTICNSSLSDFQFNGTAISFNVSGENGTAGFCRVCMPTALMNETYHVFVNGTEVQCNLLPCSNTTHSYLYFDYTHLTQEVIIIIIPEFPSILILPLPMIATLLAVKVCRRKRICYVT